MKVNKENILDYDFKKINELIKRSDITKFINSDEITDDIFEDEEADSSNNESFPGSVKFKMDSLKINLFINFKAPYNSSNIITIENIKDMINKYGEYCASQVDWDLLRDLYNRVTVEGEIVSDTVIAKGRRVKAQIPEHISLKSDLILNNKSDVKNEALKDLYNSDSFIFVKKEEYLGDIIPESLGVPGLNLLGEEIPYTEEVVNNFTLGDNIYINGNKIYSAIDGTFKILKDKISVKPCLIITSNIDSQVGDLEYKGDIWIQKSVKEGYSVESKGDIYVKGLIEPANVICGNNLNANKGIVGSSEYCIKCLGYLKTLYADHVTIKSKNSVYIDKAIINSNVYSSGKLVIGEKGILVGGLYSIQNGIIAGNIGNESGVESHIIVGVDYIVEEKLKKIQFIIIEIMIEMDRLQKNLKAVNSREKKEEIKKLFLSLRKRMYSLNNYSRSLLKKLDINENSTVDVHGTIYPGSYIEICHVSLFINKPLTKVRFYLDKDKGKINWNYL